MNDHRYYSSPVAYPAPQSGVYPSAAHPMAGSRQPYADPYAARGWSHQPAYNPYGGAVGPFGNVVEMGKFGAVVGLCGAGAASLHRLQAGEVDRRGALVDTLRGGAVAGVATAAATLVGSRVSNGWLSLAATLAAGTAVAYALTAEATPDTAVTAADAAADPGVR
ncbi:magnetosome protein MamC [Thiohalocapsa halophila]|nr:magnetosome protein MamC [Thiohalocapsa halophila]